MDTITTKDSSPKPLFRVLVIVIYCLFLLVIALFAYRRPSYNWDMFGYMALAIQPDHSNANELHKITYKEAKDNIPPAVYKHLVESEYKKKLSEDSQAFFQTLPFYAVKPLYIRMVVLFHKIGFSLPVSTVLPSIVFYLMIGLLSFYWISRYLKIVWAFVSSLFIMLSGFMVVMARLSTPDCVSAFFLLASFYFIIQKPSVKWLFFFLLLSVFTRLDNIVPCFFILSFLFFTKKWQQKIKLQYYLLMLGILIACYFGITAITMRPFGWNVFYYPTYVLHMNLSHTVYSSFSLKAYIELIISQGATTLLFCNFIFFMFFFMLILYSPSVNYKSFTLEQSFSILLLLIIFTRFILYPDLSDRFNIAYYLCFIIIFIKKYSGILAKIRSSPAALN